MSKEGYRSYIEVPIGSKDRLYRVKVGRFKSKDETDALASQLKAAGYNIKICADGV